MPEHNLYKNNYLTKVIARIDYNSLEVLEKPLSKSLMEYCLQFFPIFEPREMISRELQISSSDIKSKEKKKNEWFFHGKNREKTLIISENFCAIEYQKQESYKNFREEFLKIKDQLFHHFDELVLSRLGLRYINNIEKNEISFTEWAKYLDPKLLSIFDVADDKNRISRAFHNLELNYEKFNIKFQYGMHNPDYPAPIRRKIFILDYDGYVSGFQNRDEVEKNFNDINEKIYNFFESCITEELRREMLG
ncbi:MAG: TIGR04255 family protein [Deltaproteobacteria bacterium]|nr:TIGR04255 family protein [Deltaproteobacteria bacterium]